MFCTKCGMSLPNDNKFCSNCGFSVDGIGGKIIMHRIGSFVGCAVGINVEIDGRKVGTLSNNGNLTVDVPFGVHRVIFKFWNGIGSIDVEVTEEFTKVFLDVKIKMGLLTGKVQVVNARKEN